jgi:hypothetical protein
MENENMPFVAVIGGLWQLEGDTATAAKAAANAIGVELAKKGFGLVVYFADPGSLEPHVVTGYVSALANGAGRIRVRYAQSQRNVRFAEEDETRTELFVRQLFPGQDWEAPFYRSLAEKDGVDAVLLLGGATSTLIAGQIAAARQVPILAVDEFGGSAAKIWSQLAARDPNLPSWGTRPVADIVANLQRQCSNLAAKRKEASRREQVLAAITAQRSAAAYAGGAFVGLLITLYLGMVYAPAPTSYPIITFAGLIAAGATGALARAVLWTSKENDPRASLLLGGVAGFVVGLAYLIPQWVGASGVLAAEDAVSATDKIQFASSVLVAISAGVGFDTVFNRLQNQAEDAAVGPPH